MIGKHYNDAKKAWKLALFCKYRANVSIGMMAQSVWAKSFFYQYIALIVMRLYEKITYLPPVEIQSSLTHSYLDLNTKHISSVFTRFGYRSHAAQPVSTLRFRSTWCTARIRPDLDEYLKFSEFSANPFPHGVHWEFGAPFFLTDARL